LTFFAALAVWTFVAPPRYVEQHVFNMQSPSHEGAFVLEARGVESIREYVQSTFYERIRNTPEQMLGRRVLSNPPGMTVLFVLCQRIAESSDLLGCTLVRWFGLDEVEDPAQRIEFAAALVYAMLLTAAWGLSIVPAYALGRLWLSSMPAMCFAFACVFNPAAVNFTPGKDPAQLLTVLLCTYLWMRAYFLEHRISGVLAGAVWLIGLGIGLIHAWAMTIIVAATCACALENSPGIRIWLTKCFLPFLAGVFATCLLIYLAMGWNVFMAAYAVGMRYREIQVPIITDPFYWTLVGLPMFLLFVGPYLWAMFGVRPRSYDGWVSAGRRRMPRGPAEAALSNASGSAEVSPSYTPDSHTLTDATWKDPAAKRLGTFLLIFCFIVMTFIYFYGNNSETPRLWIPFIPLLLLGFTLRRGLFHADTPKSRRVCMFLIGLQLVGTLAHWSLMDVRESEYRLSTGRMWD